MNNKTIIKKIKKSEEKEPNVNEKKMHK